MPIAAVPKYLGQEFKNASPGMRFGMYLKLWGMNNRSREALWTTHDINYRVAGKDKTERAFKDKNKVSALHEAQALNPVDKAIMQSLPIRQQSAFATVLPNEGLQLEAKSTAPFTTGLGNEHPLENGFAFLNPYGLPYLPGSGVKGVLRQAARELASGEWGDTHGWSADKNIELSIGKTAVHISMLDALFGLECQDGDQQHLRGALTFWDVIPQIKGNSLTVEIMTPHQSHYYQQKSDRKSGDSVTPHDSGSPTPISFLTVPPGSSFSFFVTCDTTLLGRRALNLVEDEHWKTLLQNAFQHAFEWLGFGAKTAVGYGAMVVDEAAVLEREQQQAEDREATERERQFTEATVGLPDDATEIERKRQESNWEDNNTFLPFAEQLLENDTPSSEAIQRLRQELEQRWKGILIEPDATQGKKQKPKYKDRPKKLAKRLLELEQSA